MKRTCSSVAKILQSIIVESIIEIFFFPSLSFFFLEVIIIFRKKEIRGLIIILNGHAKGESWRPILQGLASERRSHAHLARLASRIKVAAIKEGFVPLKYRYGSIFSVSVSCSEIT